MQQKNKTTNHAGDNADGDSGGDSDGDSGDGGGGDCESHKFLARVNCVKIQLRRALTLIGAHNSRVVCTRARARDMPSANSALAENYHVLVNARARVIAASPPPIKAIAFHTTANARFEIKRR